MKSSYRKRIEGSIEITLLEQYDKITVLDNLIDYVGNKSASLEILNESDPDDGYFTFDFRLETPGVCKSEAPTWGNTGGNPGYSEDIDRITVDFLKEYLNKYAEDVFVFARYETYTDREVA